MLQLLDILLAQGSSMFFLATSLSQLLQVVGLLSRLTRRRSLPATQKLPWEPHQDAVYCSPVALILAMLGYELASRDSQCDFALFLSTAGLI